MTTPAPDTQAPPTLKGGLGVGSIVFMVLAGAAPLTAVIAVVPLVYILADNAAAGVYFLVAALVLGLFAVGYTAMARRVSEPGAMYSFISAGLGRRAGSAAAVLAVGSYFANLVAVYAYGGVVTAQTFIALMDWTTPWWMWSIGLFAGVSVLGYLNIDLSAKVLGIVLVVETLVVLVIDVGILVAGGADGIDATPLNPIEAMSGAPALGIMIAFLAFIGFEATAVFRDEARDPERTVPRATYIAIFGIGVFYALSAWLLTLGFGSERVVERAGEDPTTFVIELAATYVSPILADVTQVLLLTSIFACLLTVHNVISRYMLSMSRRGLVTAWLGRVHPRHRAPSNASLALTAAVGVSLVIMLVLGLDPIADTYATLSGVVGYGITMLMAATSIAVIVFFARRPGPRSMWKHVVAPVLSLVALGGVAVVAFTNIDILTGSTATSMIVLGYLAGLIVLGLVLDATRRSTVRAAEAEVAAEQNPRVNV